MCRVVTCVSRGFIKWRYNAELSMLFRQLFNFHWIPPGESFTSFIIILPSARQNRKRKTLPWFASPEQREMFFLGAGSRRCSVALLSIFYQERAGNIAPSGMRLHWTQNWNIYTIYSRDPGYILVLLHTNSPIKTVLSNVDRNINLI